MYTYDTRADRTGITKPSGNDLQANVPGPHQDVICKPNKAQPRGYLCRAGSGQMQHERWQADTVHLCL